MKTREDVMEDVLTLLSKVSEDWEFTGKVTPETRFFADLGLASLDVVVLGTAIQEHYGRVFPFMEFFAQLGEKQVPDIPVTEWVDFIHRHLMEVPDEVASITEKAK